MAWETLLIVYTPLKSGENNAGLTIGANMCIGEIIPNTAIPVGQQAAAIVTTTDGNGTIAISSVPLIFQVRVVYMEIVLLQAIFEIFLGKN
jgi:hypothetical protein